jgi:hypothetical protein
MVYEWEICLFHFMHYHNFLKKKVPAWYISSIVRAKL